MAKECGMERPEYERVAYSICDFVVSDQQDNGCYAKGWLPNGESIYREGTIGCFLVPAMIEAYRRSGEKKYLDSGLKAYNHYLAELKENGFTTAGALDTWCIDKESSISLLRSAIRFHRLTGSPEYIEDALAISYYLSTWLWHYDGIYPEGDDFSEYGYHTFGATSVSVQHNHLDPYAKRQWRSGGTATNWSQTAPLRYTGISARPAPRTRLTSSAPGVTIPIE